MPSATFSPLRRAVWDLAELPDADRAWIIEQLDPDERQRLNRVLIEAEHARLGKPRSEEAEPGDRFEWNKLPDWLLVRCLLAMSAGASSSVLAQLTWLRRLRFRSAMKHAQASTMTPKACEALLRAMVPVQQPERT